VSLVIEAKESERQRRREKRAGAGGQSLR